MEDKESTLFNAVYREIGAELGLDAAIRVTCYVGALFF